ncbi:TIGR02099 family protein [Alicycliphilus denitrificans]|uniref:TIGR02099 family protein n=1 Tax=Alicycliphilus denitrificans TaxID=179636 RepID=A0A858ZZG9_9BURK|nr:YhdP family protein [Alicycliphilus denitrificans]QKD46047.1 TIGR02099 family protein [Alicycliphilus denitrificans]
MTELSSHPSRLLRFVAGCARWGLGLLLALWLLLAAAWGALHGWIVPRIGDFRPQLEAQAQRALGVPVRIAAVSARSEGFFPAVELSGVALLDPQGREALRLPRVVVALSPRSLLRLGFEQIYIEGPELDIRREQDGRIFIAGLSFRDTGETDSAAADWLFAQPEVAIRGGTLRWSDALRGAEPLALTQVDLVLRNGALRHGIRLDATPPPDWGERFTLRGQFRQPLLTTHGGNWQRWSGQMYAYFAQVDVSRLNRHADLGTLQVRQGRGALRAWVDVQQGRVVGGAADMALGAVDATLRPDLRPLLLGTVTGRVGGRWLDDGFELATRDLQFVADDGLRWTGGNLFLRHTGQGRAGWEQGELRADRLDLAAVSQIAGRLPLDEAVHGVLQTYAPRGVVEQLQAGWRGPLQEPRQYQLRGKVTGLSLAAQDGVPAVAGLAGADVEFELTQAGGRAALAMAGGRLLLPGVFEDPVVPVQQLSATVRWQIEGERIAVQASDLRFANADAQGEARLAWQTADPATSPARARLPGVLDLAGTLQRADATRVHRYLPLAVPAQARHYVRDAIRAGSASQVQFRVKGDLHDFPYGHVPHRGEFRVAAQVKDVRYDYVPPALLEPGDRPWPALTGLGGELVFDRAGMTVRNATASFAGRPAVRVQKVGARIADLEHSVVEVDAQVRGPLQDMLALVGGSQIAQLTHGALDRATASGAAELQLGLNLPIDAMERSSVRGSVLLTGNEVRFVPEAPTVSGARGAVQFNEHGFTLAGVQGQALGGEVRLEGGMGAQDSTVRVRARGTATAEGLRAAPQLGLLSRLARHASGSAAYTLNLGVRRGEPEIQVNTDLVGMALAAPAPLGKAAQAPLAVRFDNQLTREAAASDDAPLQDQLTLELGGVARLAYVRALDGGQPRVLRGAIAVGEVAKEGLSLPEQGVFANAALAELDADAWRALLDDPAPAPAPAPAAQPAGGGPAPDYLPTRLALRAATLTAQGRTLHDVVAGATRAGTVWRANVSARELEGYLEYLPGGAPAADGQAPQDRLHARLARLAIPQAADMQVNELLDARQPGRLPALDIVVQDFELRGRRLGRLEIEARNRAAADGQREWRLSRFNLVAPEATLTSSGSWALLGGAGGEAQRRTAMDFELDIRDSGELLARFGMPGVLRRGQGRMAGQVSWLGSPLSPDYRSMTGQMHVDMQAGQFLKAEPGLAKLLSVLSLQSLPRRFALDFRDVFSEGFAFDFVRGDVHIAKGVATTNNLQMKGVNAAVLMEGSADIARETQDLHVVVVPEINAMTASLVATAINPVVGLGSFLAQVFLRGPLIQAATQDFRIDGTWAEPHVERIRGRKSTPADAAAVPEPGGKP